MDELKPHFTNSNCLAHLEPQPVIASNAHDTVPLSLPRATGPGVTPNKVAAIRLAMACWCSLGVLIPRVAAVATHMGALGQSAGRSHCVCWVVKLW